MLKRTDIPILWNEEVTLFEDELHDNGVSRISVKVVGVASLLLSAVSSLLTCFASLCAEQRVMPTCFLCLLRFWLRVDGVLIRLRDTRLFHAFNKPYLIRDYSEREDTFEMLAKVHPSAHPSIALAHSFSGLLLCTEKNAHHSQALRRPQPIFSVPYSGQILERENRTPLSCACFSCSCLLCHCLVLSCDCT